jgi:hypothetical protein
MNKTFATIILAASVFATLGVSPVNAQERGIADVPFAFHIKSQTMPAGKYEVKQIDANNSALFSVFDRRGHGRFVGAPLEGTANPADPKLTFACYRGECSLVKIEVPGSDVSFGLTPDSSYKVGLASLVRVGIKR